MWSTNPPEKSLHLIKIHFVGERRKEEPSWNRRVSWHVGCEPCWSISDLNMVILVILIILMPNTLRERGARGECLGMACLVSLENFLDNFSGSGDLSHPLRVRVLFSVADLSLQLF